MLSFLPNLIEYPSKQKQKIRNCCQTYCRFKNEMKWLKPNCCFLPRRKCLTTMVANTTLREKSSWNITQNDIRNEGLDDNRKSLCELCLILISWMFLIYVLVNDSSNHYLRPHYDDGRGVKVEIDLTAKLMIIILIENNKRCLMFLLLLT